jgi:hypothetical protein
MELKFMLQSGEIQPESWKKKLEETFDSNKYHRCLAAVESLSCNEPKNCRVISNSGLELPWKKPATKLAVDMMKADIGLVKEGLIQTHEKKKRDKQKKEQLVSNEEGLDIDEILEKYRKLDEKMLDEKEWRFAAYNVPLEVHIEVIRNCFEMQMWPEFEDLLDSALIRLKFRRYEVPYLATIDVLMSAEKDANSQQLIKLPQDLNAANLKIELKKLRQKAQNLADDEEAKDAKGGAPVDPKKAPPPAAKDAKKPPAGKGGADAKPGELRPIKPDPEDEHSSLKASRAELALIQHIFVNLLIQRSKSPKSAIVGIDVVMADENTGPEIPDFHFAVAVPIRQHDGVYEK